MKLTSFVTPIFHLGDSLFHWISKIMEKNKKTHLLEKSILAVTSKIVSLSEKRIEPISKWKKKENLIRKEADHYLKKSAYNTHLTIKENLLIPSAGIDTSNAEGEFYILYPKAPYKSAKLLLIALKTHFSLKHFGILITDSRTLPLRKGVTGIALSYWGFRGVKNMAGQKDLFGKTLKFTSINVADALAAATTFKMGEGNERTPLVLIENAPVEFFKNTESTDKKELLIEPKKDLFYSFYEHLFNKKL